MMMVVGEGTREKRHLIQEFFNGNSFNSQYTIQSVCVRFFFFFFNDFFLFFIKNLNLIQKFDSIFQYSLLYGFRNF